jgi:hypothetical protein
MPSAWVDTYERVSGGWGWRIRLDATVVADDGGHVFEDAASAAAFGNRVLSGAFSRDDLPPD